MRYLALILVFYLNYISAFCTNYYVKNGGNDFLSGTSDALAWATLSKVNSRTFSPGDNIYFKRGDTFRGAIAQIGENGNAGNWITYSAYGTGAKPLILDAKDLSSGMALHSGNIWKTKQTLGTNRNDIGNLMFDNEEGYGIKVDEYADLNLQGEFFYNTSDHNLYLYCEGNPQDIYSHIEACGAETLGGDSYNATMYWRNSSYIRVQYLDIRYSLFQAIEFRDCSNVTIEYCSTSWTGGGWLNGSPPYRFGNALQLYQNCTNAIIRYNEVYQAFDAGISPQIGDYTNIQIYYNIIKNCYYNFEYWIDYSEVCDGVYYMNNTSVDAGDSFSNSSAQRPDAGNGRHLMIWQLDGDITNFVIRNNIFHNCTQAALRVTTGNENKMDSGYNIWNVEVAVSYQGSTFTTLADWKDYSHNEINSIDDDPLFISSTDFHLQDVSPAQNRGIDVGLTVDFDGVSVGDHPEIGAYEYVFEEPPPPVDPPPPDDPPAGSEGKMIKYSGIVKYQGMIVVGTQRYWLTLTDVLIKYRKGIRDGYYVIDYSFDGGSSWELNLVILDLDEDLIIMNIDDGIDGYRHQIRSSDYCIDLELDATGFLGTEDINWTNIFKIEK